MDLFFRVILVLFALSAGVNAYGAVEAEPADKGVSYYVDSRNGNDKNSGARPDRAWKSLAKVNTVVFSPGDKILFKAASRYTGQLKPQGSGSKDRRIVMDQYGQGEKPRIDGEGKVESTLLLKNVEYWTVRNLEITNQGPTVAPKRSGVVIEAENFGTAHQINLQNLYIHDVNGTNVKSDGGGFGILWTNGGKKVKSRFDGLVVEGCLLVRTDRNGICGWGYTDRNEWYPSLNVVIRNNLLEDIGGDGIVPIGTDGCLIEHNVLRGARIRAEDYAAGIWPWGADNTVIQFNEVSEIKGTNDGQAFDSDYNCRNSVFQYNYSHDNEGGFFLICNLPSAVLPGNVGNIGTIIRYNISQNDGGKTWKEPIFDFNGNPRDVQIYNNVIYVSDTTNAPLINTWNWGVDGAFPENVRFYNNIFYSPKGRVAYQLGGGDYTFSHNVYFGNHQSPPKDAHAVMSDPKFVAAGTGKDGIKTLDGYKLNLDSPCVGRGKSIKDNGGRDFWGNALPDLKGHRPSIGVYEFTKKTQDKN